jgi:hypothetical protein
VKLAEIGSVLVLGSVEDALVELEVSMTAFMSLISVIVDTNDWHKVWPPTVISDKSFIEM